MAKYSKNKNWRAFFKKNKKILSIIRAIIWSLIIFLLGNYWNNSYWISQYNPFKFIFGVNKIDIQVNTIPQIENDTAIISFEVTNIGDKKISNLNILYQFCDEKEQKKVETGKTELLFKQSEIFSFETKEPIDRNCKYITNKTDAYIYRNKTNCYIYPIYDYSETCRYCPINFEVWGNRKIIYNDSFWYSQLRGYISNRALLIWLYEQGIKINLTFAKDNKTMICDLMTNKINKSTIYLEATIKISALDASTMCMRGEDIEWCKKYWFPFQEDLFITSKEQIELLRRYG